ncbi:MAG TPA: nucleotidyltransferase family protein [Acidobacteriaceae bacterium]|jgi:molybdenum cofactor cytidylyltransferase|nr:nucleotidyltransferase family protein [Acidobacteriaceae bacterium]
MKSDSLPAIFLAAGASRRLGQPKQLLQIEGRDESLLDHTLRIAITAGLDPVFVVLGAHAAAIQRATPLEGCTVLLNSDWQEGMASSIRCGVHAAQEINPRVSGVVLLVCDQPALTSEHLQALLAAHRQAPEKIVASRYVGRPGVPILAPRALFPELLALSGDHGARDILRAGKTNLIEVPFALGEWDVDRPEDAATL